MSGLSAAATAVVKAPAKRSPEKIPVCFISRSRLVILPERLHAALATEYPASPNTQRWIALRRHLCSAGRVSAARREGIYDRRRRRGAELVFTFERAAGRELRPA